MYYLSFLSVDLPLAQLDGALSLDLEPSAYPVRGSRSRAVYMGSPNRQCSQDSISRLVNTLS